MKRRLVVDRDLYRLPLPGCRTNVVRSAEIVIGWLLVVIALWILLAVTVPVLRRLGWL